MKKITFLFGLLIMAAMTYAQVPQAFKYQAVARDVSGVPLENQQIPVKISILSGEASGELVYSERHVTITNSMGLFDLEIGNPDEVISGTFQSIAWGENTHFLKLELDENGGTNYQLMGVSQLLSVPYALISENTVNNDDADADPTNELQTISKDGQTVILSNNGGSFTDEVNDADADPTNEFQTISKDGQTVTLSNSGGSFTDEVNDADADPANELQNLSQNGLNVMLSQGGGTINVADNDNDASNELQQLSKVGSTVSLSQNGGSFTDEVNDADANPANELQTLSQIGLNVTLSQGGGTISVADNDNNPSNELQGISRNGLNVTLSQGGGTFNIADNDNDPANEFQSLANTKIGNLVSLEITSGTGTTLDVSDTDSDPVNELQTLTQNGLEVTLSQGGGTISVADNDNQPTNELQQLTKVGNVVTLSQNGGSFTDEVNDADANPANELQNLSNTKNGNLIDLEISNGTATTLDVTDSDADPVNELQVLTQTDYQVSLSQGGGYIMTGVKSYTQAQIDAMTPNTGLTVHNVTTNCINYYFNGNWFEACGTCTPQPTQANAGIDAIIVDGILSLNLAANEPEMGNGLWSVVSGNGGIFEDATNPTTLFTGLPFETYNLQWTITNTCNSSFDQVTVLFASLHIGETFQGGKIAYILQPGDPGYTPNVQHGIIAAPSDQSTSTQWGCYYTSIPGADGTALGTGYQNTLDIVAGCITVGFAAQICNNLELNGYTDWFLPSKDELNKLFLSKDIIGGFIGDYYWSSSEASSENAWNQVYNWTGGQDTRVKNGHGRVRAVRAF